MCELSTICVVYDAKSLLLKGVSADTKCLLAALRSAESALVFMISTTICCVINAQRFLIPILAYL